MIGPDIIICDIMLPEGTWVGLRIKAPVRQRDLLVSRAISRQAINHLADRRPLTPDEMRRRYILIFARDFRRMTWFCMCLLDLRLLNDALGCAR